MKNKMIQIVEATQFKKDAAPCSIGDQVDVNQLILEDKKQRTQVFAGVVIAMKGECMREMFVSIRWGERTLAVPLAQLEVIDGDDQTREAVEDWHYWVGMGYQF